MARVRFELKQDADGWPPSDAETLWCTIVPLERGPDSYEVDNVPFYACGIALGDVVSVTIQDCLLTFERVLRRSGNSTYRVMLAKTIDVQSDRFSTLWRDLDTLGCSYEGMNGVLLAINVPEGAVEDAYRVLEFGERIGIWNFEEGYCHVPPSPDDGAAS